MEERINDDDDGPVEDDEVFEEFPCVSRIGECSLTDGIVVGKKQFAACGDQSEGGKCVYNITCQTSVTRSTSAIANLLVKLVKQVSYKYGRVSNSPLSLVTS